MYDNFRCIYLTWNFGSIDNSIKLIIINYNPHYSISYRFIDSKHSDTIFIGDKSFIIIIVILYYEYLIYH